MEIRRQDDTEDSSRVVGSRTNFWFWSSDSGWDLTHPPTPESPPITPRLKINCEISNISIDPIKTALLIIDMQNYSMSSLLGVDAVPSVLQAQERLLRFAIPAARKSGIQIIWLNWGLTEDDLETVPPGSRRVFGWRAKCDAVDYDLWTPQRPSCQDKDAVQHGETPTGRGPGEDLGDIVLPNGATVHAGRALMKGTWNADLHGPLNLAFEQGQNGPRPDVLIHKDRNSGLWDASSHCTRYLAASGIRTLLFSGMNTDQCVMATLQDAHSRGFDTVMLRDVCATDSPTYAQQNAEFNCCINWGFLSSSLALAQAAGVY